MLFILSVEFFFILICGFSLVRNTPFRSRDNELITIALLFLVLQVARLYCQNYFLDIPDYREMFYKMGSIFDIGPSQLFTFYSNSAFDNTEYGYLLLISLFRCFSDSFELFLFLISCCELFAAYSFCKYYKINPLCALPAYFALTFITFQIGMLRQAIAFVFLLLALKHINNKIKFIIILLIGVCFHRSLVFCILLFGVDYWVDKRIIIITFSLALGVYLLQIDYIGQMWEAIGATDMGRIEHYLNVDRENSFLGVGFWERVLFFAFMTVLRYKQDKIGARDNSLVILYNIGAFAIIFQLALYSSPTITSRLRYYVVIAPTLYIFEYIRCYIRANNRVILVLPIFLYLLLYSAYQASYIIGL